PLVSARHADRVLAAIGRIHPDGRCEGRIVPPVSRAHTTFVRTFHYGNRRNYVTPMDEKISNEIENPPGMEFPGKKAAEETAADGKSRKGKKSVHRVLGDEAARRTAWDDLENLVVDVEITDWPTATKNPRGRVVEILGYEDDFGVDVEIIIRRFHLPHRFPPEVLEE